MSVASDGQSIVALDVAEDQVWLARSDGVIVVVDRAQQELVAEESLAPLSETEDESIQVNQVAVGAGFGYAVAEGFGIKPVVQVDRGSFELVARDDILSAANNTAGLTFDGDHLWVLMSNSFDLFKLDPATLDLVGSVELGQNPDDPDGALGDWYGSGQFADVVDSVWVVDHESVRLLHVDKASLQARVVDDLSDLTTLETYIEFKSNQRDVFLLLGDSDTVVRFDGDTGERIQLYDFADAGGARSMAVSEGYLYVSTGDSLSPQLLEVEIDSGATLQAIERGRFDQPLFID